MKIYGLAWFSGIAFVALSWPWNAYAYMTCRPDAPYALSFDGSTLSLDSNNACLGAVLEALARQTDARIYLPSSLADKRVADTFRDVPLEQGIKRILKGTNYVLQTQDQTVLLAAESAYESARLEIWVLSRKHEPTLLDRGKSSEQLTAVSKEEEMLTLNTLAEQARSDPNPEVRALAVQLITQADDGTKATEMILTGMQNPDPEVRSAALAMARDIGPEATVVFDLITEIALNDESPWLRRQALLQLVETNVPPAIAAETLRKATDDEDQEVSNLARNLLKLVGP